MSLRQNRRSGINPLSYIGIDSIAPLNLLRVDRPPTTDDYIGFNVGDWWIDTTPIAPSPQQIWVLVKVDGRIATWVRLAPVSGITLFIEDDEFPAGRAIPDNTGAITLSGSTTTRTTGSGSTVTYEFPAGPILGTTLMGGSAGNVWGGFTSSDNSITIEPDFDFINIKTNASGIERVLTDAAQAFPTAGDVNIYGGLNIETTADNSNTLTVHLKNSVVFDELTLSLLGEGVLQTDSTGEIFSSNGLNGQALISGTLGPLWQDLISSDLSVIITGGANTINLETVAAAGGIDSLSADTGSATPLDGSINVIGTVNFNTFGDNLSTLQINLSDNITINGTLTVSTLGEGVVSTDGFGLLSVSKGLDGQILIASASGAPYQWKTLTSSDSSVLISNSANHINLEAASGSGIVQLAADVGSTALNITYADFSGSRNIIFSLNGSSLNLQSTSLLNLNSLTLSFLAEGIATIGVNPGNLVSSINGTDGQILFSGGYQTVPTTLVLPPTWGDVTSTGGSITITRGPGTLDFKDPSYSPGGLVGLGTESFLAYQPSTVLVENILYYLGDDVILTEVYDTGNNFYPGDGAGAHATYTAPSTGKYFLSYNHISRQVTPPPPVPPPAPPRYDPLGYMEIMTSRNTCINAYLDTDFEMTETGVWANYLSVLADLDAGDTVTFKSWIDNLYAYVNGDATELRTFVCGYKVS
jgi:hypothetical protein